MLFSSITFLYYFLPIVLAVYFIVPARGGSVRARNVALLIASIVFYIWGEPVYVLLMIGQTVAGWAFGLLIDRAARHGDRRMMKLSLAGAVAVGILCLGFFKYSDFFIANVNALFGANIAFLNLALPIGISFYTFQILSYNIDLYDGRVSVQKNLPDFSAYVMLFPQLVAGPIVRYAVVEKALSSRKSTWEDFRCGARRFTIGLAKKVLIANTLGELVEIYKSYEAGAGDAASSTLYVWLYAVAYALHIYFDFSGYSDMAIGLGRIFGFRYPENFNYPYIAVSVTDFWRRWHISMSSWFRDYVYIRLGGSRVARHRHIFNILVVWLLTGFWHGAGWNFILWGLYYALLLLLEKYVLSKLRVMSLAPVSHIYVILIFLVGWIFFDANVLSDAVYRLGLMFGGASIAAGPEALYYLRSYAVVLAVAAIGATPLPAKLARRMETAQGTAQGDRSLVSLASGIYAVLEPVFIIVMLAVVTAYMVDGSFNPFIYFRF